MPCPGAGIVHGIKDRDETGRETEIWGRESTSRVKFVGKILQTADEKGKEKSSIDF